jgi:hypothetical protein
MKRKYLPEGGDVEPASRAGSSDAGPRAKALRLFYMARDSSHNEALRDVISDAKSIEPMLSLKYRLFTRSACAVAAIKLEMESELPSLAELVADCGDDHPCLDELVTSGTELWLRTAWPDNWFAMVGIRGAAGFERVAKRSENAYLAIRAAMTRELPNAVNLLFPLHSLAEHEAYGNSARELYKKLEVNADSDARAL